MATIVSKKVNDYQPRDFFERRISALQLERSSFWIHWKELQEYVLPRRGRFFIDDRNRIDHKRSYRSIVNSTATQAIKTARAGLLSGIASPSRTWMNLVTSDESLMENQNVRVWLDQATKVIMDIYAKSNFYSMTSVMLAELLLFGTGAMTQDEDPDDTVRFYTHTIGSYVIGQDSKYRVNVFAREFMMTISQLIDEFGEENVSPAIVSDYKAGNLDRWIRITQYIGDNPEYNPVRVEGKYKKIISCYWETGNPDKQMWLRKTGYEEFPTSIPRWDLTAEDIWGTDCPGMIALGDIKQLQTMERRKAQAIDKLVNPPLKGPSSLRNVPVSSLPGGLTIFDTDASKEGLSPIYQVEPRIQEMLLDIQKLEKRIEDVFFVPLFFAITDMEGIQPKNELELNQRDQERLQALGPVYERLQQEFLSGTVQRTFNICVRKNIMPPPPSELAGQALKIKYVSSVAMAQRSTEIDAMNEVITFAAGLVKMGITEAMDKIDANEAINEVALIAGAPPKIIRSDADAAKLSAAQQQAAQQQQQQQNQNDMAQTVVDNATS